MFQFVTGLAFTFGRCSSSIPVRRISVCCCSSLLSRNICSTFVAWVVLTARCIIKSHETRVCAMIQHRDISRRYLMSVYGLVGWRDSNLAFTVRYCRSVTDN